jgi:hypothetical protein
MLHIEGKILMKLYANGDYGIKVDYAENSTNRIYYPKCNVHTLYGFR